MMKRGRDLAHPSSRRQERLTGAGFTLIEVSIALVILAVGLTVLLEAQSASLANAGRARDMTVATLLARSKMIDIEQKLFDEGFTLGEVEEEGNFEEEGHKEYEWAYRVTELEIDLSTLTSLCGGFGEETDDESAAMDCESMLGAFGAPFESLTDELGRSMRLVELTVTWPRGKHQASMNVRSVVTREDFNLESALPQGGAGLPTNPAGLPGGGVPKTPSTFGK